MTSRAGTVAARLAQIVPTFLLIGVVVFVLVRLLPGDPVSALLGDHASDETIDRLRAQLGLDQPVWTQFALFVRRAVQGDLGDSIALRVPVVRLIGDRLPVTLLLSAMAAVIALCLAVPLALAAASTAGRWPDLAIRGVFQVGLSSPVFFVGLILLTVFAARLRWFPVGGYGTDFFGDVYHLLLPALTLALSLSAVIMRNLRAALLDVLTADYVEFARAKGLSGRMVMLRHVLRNAGISTVALLGLHVGTLLGGAVITESVFAVPGVGRLMIESIFARDYPVVQALTLVLAVLVSLAFLATDLVQMWLDPRIAR